MSDLHAKAWILGLFNAAIENRAYLHLIRPVASTAQDGIIKMAPEPKYTPIPHWCLISGMTRTATYGALAQGYLRAIKQPGGRRTLIDVEHGMAWLHRQPLVSFASKIAA